MDREGRSAVTPEEQLRELAVTLRRQMRASSNGMQDVTLDTDDGSLQVISSKPNLTGPTVPPAPRPPRSGDNHIPQEGFIVQVDGPAFPSKIMNRRERRRADAIARQKAKGSGKAPSTRMPPPTRPGPVPAPSRPGLSLLEKIAKFTVEGINEDGTFLAFLAKFRDGAAIVVLDPTDEVNAEEIVRAAVAGRAERGFVGIMSPLIHNGKFEWAAQRNSSRVDDMEKVLQIALKAITRKMEQERKEEADGSADGSAAQPPADAGNTPADDPAGAGSPPEQT